MFNDTNNNEYSDLMKYKKLIYIGVPGSSVFQSQVIGLLREVKTKPYFSKIVLFLGVKGGNGWNKEINELERYGIEVVTFKMFPNYNFFFYKQVKELNRLLKIYISDNTVIHLRGESLAAAVKKNVDRLGYSNVRILSDVRGASYEETEIYNKRKVVLFRFKLFQHRKNIKFLYKNSDFVSCVSQALKEYVINRSPIDTSKVYVNHCVAGREFVFSKEIRKIYRQKLKLIDKDILILFVTGGNKKWQNTDRIIQEIVSRGYKVLNMSKSEIDHKNVINIFVPYSEVPHYLSAADVGIIWRNNDTVNHVACPVKFSEYVCSGLPVIANNGVDVINKYIEKTNFGVVINSFAELDEKVINKLVLLNRDDISNNASQSFGIEKISDNYISVYKKLLK